MLFQFIGLLALSNTFAAADTYENNVTVVSLDKSGNSSKGEGHLAIAGNLTPFGSIGAGCGVNWQGDDDAQYGGGLQAGSPSFGLGGGFTIFPDHMRTSAGIGFTKTNASSNFDFDGKTNGSFSLRFSSSSPFSCVPTKEGKWNVLTCTSDGKE